MNANRRKSSKRRRHTLRVCILQLGFQISEIRVNQW